MIVQRDGVYRVEGPVTLANVRQVLAAGSTLFSGSPVRVDFSGVTDVDSSVLSLVMEWMRSGERSNRILVFLNLPHNLLSLARVYGVLDLIPQQAATD